MVMDVWPGLRKQPHRKLAGFMCIFNAVIYFALGLTRGSTIEEHLALLVFLGIVSILICIVINLWPGLKKKYLRQRIALGLSLFLTISLNARYASDSYLLKPLDLLILLTIGIILMIPITNPDQNA